LVEEYIPGRELTVAVLDNQALPVLEIKPKVGFFDYENKYTYGRTDYIVPAEIGQKTAEHLQRQALFAFHSVGCESYARVDFRLTSELKAYCLEINTLPGMTSTSLVPKMAKAAGISFEELIERIIKNSL
jgi:D-alanine-D-alanine ligase